jgi:hypothetical protein
MSLSQCIPSTTIIKIKYKKNSVIRLGDACYEGRSKPFIYMYIYIYKNIYMFIHV